MMMKETLIYADDRVLVNVSELDLKIIIECFDTLCMRRGLKVNEGKSKEILFVCDVANWEYRLEQVKSFKYFLCLVK